jgi:hypothetical protein
MVQYLVPLRYCFLYSPFCVLCCGMRSTQDSGRISFLRWGPFGRRARCTLVPSHLEPRRARMYIGACPACQTDTSQSRLCWYRTRANVRALPILVFYGKILYLNSITWRSRAKHTLVSPFNDLRSVLHPRLLRRLLLLNGQVLSRHSKVVVPDKVGRKPDLLEQALHGPMHEIVGSRSGCAGAADVENDPP